MQLVSVSPAVGDLAAQRHRFIDLPAAEKREHDQERPVGSTWMVQACFDEALATTHSGSTRSDERLERFVGGPADVFENRLRQPGFLQRSIGLVLTEMVLELPPLLSERPGRRAFR